MNSDSCFVIGDTHLVCEDYAATESVDAWGKEICTAIIADGCSSSKDTDVGARIMLHTIKRALMTSAELDDELLKILVEDAGRVASSLRLGLSCLDATIVGLRAVISDKCDHLCVDSFMAGDGVVARRCHDMVEIWQYVSGNEYPLYLSYMVDNERENAVRSKIGGEAFWHRRIFHRIDTGHWQHDGSIDVLPPKDGDGDFIPGPSVDPVAFDEFAHCNHWNVPHGSGVWAVFSDGVSSFSDSEGRELPVSQIVCELMEFKGVKGPFVKRRMNGFLRKAKKNNWRHHDDLSMAAIVI